MRAEYYSLMYDLKFKEFLLEKWHRRDTIIDAAIMAFITVISAGCVSMWAIWQRLPALWGILIMFAQCVQLIRPYLPYAHRISALNYFIPAIRLLNTDADIMWRNLQLTDDADYGLAYADLSRRYADLESRYMSTFFLPHSARLEKNAFADAERFKHVYWEGGDSDEPDCLTETKTETD